jgi:DNA primase
MNTLATQSHSRDSLRDLIARVDLVALVERYTAPGRRTGASFTFSCPNPAHPDTHPSFTVSTGRDGLQRWKCFSQCNAHGDALDLVKWLTGADTKEAARTLRDFLGDPRRDYAPRQITRTNTTTRKQLTEITTPNTTQAATEFLSKYLTARKWPLEVVEEFGLCVVTDTRGEFRVRHSYFTPDRSRVLWYQDRGKKQSRTKWLSPRGVPSTLYNLPSMTQEKLEVVVLCEGPADTITAACALRGVERVAVLGVPGASAWKHNYHALLEECRVVIATDNDTAGNHLAEVIAFDVANTTRLTLDTGKDLTDTAHTYGLDSVRSLLLTAAQLNTTEAEEIALLLQAFPNGTLLEGVAA